MYWYVSEMRKLQFVCAVPFRWHFYQSGGTGELNTLHSIRCVKMYAPPNHCHQLHQAFVQWWGPPEAQSRSSSVERWWLDEVKDWWLNFHSLCFVFVVFCHQVLCLFVFSTDSAAVPQWWMLNICNELVWDSHNFLFKFLAPEALLWEFINRACFMN